MTKRCLTDLFTDLNYRFFDSRLPTYNVRRELPPACEIQFSDRTVRRIVHDDDRDHWIRMPGCCDLACYFPCESRWIYVARNLSPEWERRVLLHVMLHIALFEENTRWMADYSHGPAFQRELGRLAAAGEAWAEEQAVQYAAVEQTVATMPELNGLDLIKVIRWIDGTPTYS